MIIKCNFAAKSAVIYNIARPPPNTIIIKPEINIAHRSPSVEHQAQADVGKCGGCWLLIKFPFITAKLERGFGAALKPSSEQTPHNHTLDLIDLHRKLDFLYIYTLKKYTILSACIK